MERRDPDHQHPLKGGRRVGDPPLTTRDCADWMGVGTEYIRTRIQRGQLKAEAVSSGDTRVVYRVHLDDFIVFLKAIKWKRIPGPTTGLDGGQS